MGWAVGFDPNWNRWIGYGVPATCDFPGCGTKIHRGLAHVCGGEPYGGEEGCGLFFCDAHIYPLCDRCIDRREPFEPTPDAQEWLDHIAADPSWAAWRAERGL